MEEGFTIDVTVENTEYSFPARLVRSGYVLALHVHIEGLTVAYEPDDERNYRAIVSEAEQANMPANTIKLIAAVGRFLNELR